MSSGLQPDGSAAVALSMALLPRSRRADAWLITSTSALAAPRWAISRASTPKSRTASARDNWRTVPQPLLLLSIVASSSDGSRPVVRGSLTRLQPISTNARQTMRLRCLGVGSTRPATSRSRSAASMFVATFDIADCGFGPFGGWITGRAISVRQPIERTRRGEWELSWLLGNSPVQVSCGRRYKKPRSYEVFWGWARQYTFVTLLLEWDGNATIVKPLDMMKMPSELRRVHHLR